MGRCGRERASGESVVAYRRWCPPQERGGQASTHGCGGRLALSGQPIPDVSRRRPLINGRKAEALALAREGREISNEAGPGFTGPILYGLLALLEDRHEDQEIALVAGEALLAQGC